MNGVMMDFPLTLNVRRLKFDPQGTAGTLLRFLRQGDWEPDINRPSGVL